MTALLRAIGVSRRFGGLLAVSDVSLELAVGELHAVIGPNGAGKSTLVNLLAGELAPTSGSISVGGRDVTGWSNWRIARCGVGRSFQRSNLMPEMTVLENARLAVPARRLWRTLRHDDPSVAMARAALARVGLADIVDRIVGTLSHGQLRQLEIGVALAMQPKVLLLDEPLAGMGPEESAIVRRIAARTCERSCRAAGRARHGRGVRRGAPHDRDVGRARAGARFTRRDQGLARGARRLSRTRV